MSQTFPIFVTQPGLTIATFAIDGSAVGATAGTAGLDGRGKFLCTISKSTNTVTITWNQAWGDVPYVQILKNTGQADCTADITTKTASSLVFNTVKETDGTGVNDADLQVVVWGYNTNNYVS
jgi:hypothetical protein